MEKEKLYQDWIKAKAKEEKAKKDRTALEEQIQAILPVFEGQSKTLHEDGFKITVKKNERYSFDQETWKTIRQDVPAELRPEKIKFEVDPKGLEYLKEKNQEVYKIVSGCVSFKINKSTFSIEKEK